MRKWQQGAAEAVRRGEVDFSANSGNLNDILNFFETIGLLTRSRALDKNMVWNSFYNEINYYCCLARRSIIVAQADDHTDWQELSYIHKKVNAVQAYRKNPWFSRHLKLLWRKLPRPDTFHGLTRQEIDKFEESLDREATPSVDYPTMLLVMLVMFDRERRRVDRLKRAIEEMRQARPEDEEPPSP